MESSHFIFFLNQKLDLNCYILTVMKFKSTHLKYKNLSFRYNLFSKINNDM